MAERVVEVKTYRVSLWCDEEGCDEEMTLGSAVLATHPETYQYTCRNGHNSFSHTRFPCVIYEEVEGG